jgi:NodT family efflux transporter outer membrane factor (OMF) lipoprotein
MKVTAKLLAATSMVALLGACANFSGIRSDAAMLRTGELASDASLPAEAGQWPDLGWASGIGGEPLQTLIDEALAGNPGIRMAEARVNAARAIEDSARAAAGPTVGAGFTSTWQRYTEHGIIPPPLAGASTTDNLLALNFAYDFDFWGRHDAELRSALAQGRVTQAEAYAARLVLSTAIARSWVQLARQQGQLELTRQLLAARMRIDELTRLRVRAGLDTQSETEQARQQIAVLRAEHSQWQESIALSRNQLAALLGQGPDRGIRILPGRLPGQMAQQAALPDALPVGLLGRRPDIVAARWRVEAAQGDIDVSKTMFYPNVNLMAFAGLSSLGLPELLKSGSRTYGAGPAIRLPVFENGALRARLKGSVAAYDAAVASYNQSVTEALHDVADQVQSLRAVHEQSEHLRNALESAATGARLARERERVGTANMLPALAAEMALLSQNKAALDLEARRISLQVGLIKALGGGYAESQSAPATGTTHPEQTHNPKSSS